jgi:predicted acyl esterase
MDITRAMVDENGEGSLNGTHSRYTNMEVPAYHLTGWWDIFIDGQIETWANMRKHLDRSKKNYKLQKLVIGPWAHQTIGQRTTGDMTYPGNVIDLIGLNFDEFDNFLSGIQTIRESVVSLTH